MSTKDWVEKDYYAILGVAKNAEAAEIKKAYRKLARELHPDHNSNDAAAERRFKDVSEANSVLGDPAKRKQYDDARSVFGRGGFRPGTRGGSGTGGTGGGGGFSFDVGDLFGGGTSGGGAGGIGDVLGGIFGGGRTQSRAARGRRGADVETSATITFDQAVDGTTVPLRMTSASPCGACAGTGAKAGTVPRVCPTCTGTGYTQPSSGAGAGFAMGEPCRDCRGRGLLVDDPCPVCHGSGRGSTSRTMQVRIPAGVADGQRIRLRGKGAPGENGGRAGDLYVSVSVNAHPVFGRSGDNLTLEVPVTFPEATLGAEITVPVRGGTPVTLKLAPGTPSGRVLRVRGKGVTRADGSHGDLLVTVTVVVPQRVDGAAREAVESFRTATAGEDVRAELMAAARRSR